MQGNPLVLDDLWEILRRRKLHITIPTLVIVLLTGALAYLLPRAYLSTATILIEQQDIPQNLVASTVTGYADERIEMIRSRVMTRDNLWGIAEKFDLYPGNRTAENKDNIIAQMREDATINMISVDTVDPRSGKPISATISFSVSYENESPELAQAVTAELADLYLNENRKSRTENTQQTSSFLNDEAQRLKKQISGQEAKVADFKVKNVGYLPESVESIAISLERSQQQLGQLNANLSTLESRYSFLRARLNSMGSSSQLSKAQADLTAAREKYSDIHPDVIRLKRVVDALKAENNQAGGSAEYDHASSDPEYVALQSELQQVAGEISSVRSQRGELNSKIYEYQERLAKSPEIERQYSALIRDLDQAINKYNDIMDKLTNARLAEELEREQKAERFTLIDAANYPSMPSKPNIPAILLLGIVLALSAGVAIATLAEHLDRRIYGPRHLVAVFKAPPIAVIPEIPG